MTTLITGASSGIGEEIARRFAKEGHDLVLVARNETKLSVIAHELRSEHGAQVTVIPLDLSRENAAKQLWDRTTSLGLEIDVLVNNAGFATHGDVADSNPARLTEQVQLNCTTLAATTALYLPAMRLRRTGTIINVASTAAFQPIPHMAIYGATKAFVLSFTEALWSETRKHGIRVLAICPGATDTAFFDVAGESAAAGAKRTTRQLVDTLFRGLKSQKPSVVDGAGNAFVARLVTRLLPKRALISIAGNSVRPTPETATQV